MGVRRESTEEQVLVPARGGQPLHAADAHQRVALGLHPPPGDCAGAGAGVLHGHPLRLPLARDHAVHHRPRCSPWQARQALEKKTGATTPQVLVSDVLPRVRVPGESEREKGHPKRGPHLRDSSALLLLRCHRLCGGGVTLRGLCQSKRPDPSGWEIPVVNPAGACDSRGPQLQEDDPG